MLSAKSYKLLIVLAIAGLVLALAAAGFLITQGVKPNEAASKAPLEKKELAPGFTLELMDGNKFDLNGHKGKPILINFFAPGVCHAGKKCPSFKKSSKNISLKA